MTMIILLMLMLLLLLLLLLTLLIMMMIVIRNIPTRSFGDVITCISFPQTAIRGAAAQWCQMRSFTLKELIADLELK